MPMYHMKEIWTPLKLVGIKFYRTEEGHIYLKVWNRKRRRII